MAPGMEVWDGMSGSLSAEALKSEDVGKCRGNPGSSNWSHSCHPQNEIMLYFLIVYPVSPHTFHM